MESFIYSMAISIRWAFLLCVTTLVSGAFQVILVSGPEYHHMADICTAATTIFSGAAKKYILMEGKPLSLKNFAGAEVSTGCTPFAPPRGYHLKQLFKSFTKDDDVVMFFVGFGGYRTFSFPTDAGEKTSDFRWKKVIHQSDWNLMVRDRNFKSMYVYADSYDAGSFFAVIGSTTPELVAVTTKSNKATQCFHADAPTVCKSNQFIQEVMKVGGGKTLKEQVRILAGTFGSDLEVWNSESDLYKKALPYGTYNYGTILNAEKQCIATGVPLCAAFERYGKNPRELMNAISPLIQHRDAADDKFIDVSNCNEFNTEDGEAAPIEGKTNQLQCIRDIVASEEIEVASSLDAWEFDDCVRAAINTVAICGENEEGWTGYSLRYAKVLHNLCGRSDWPKRRVVTALENSFGPTCDTNEYPDNKDLAILFGIIGITLSSLIICVGKPLDRPGGESPEALGVRSHSGSDLGGTKNNYRNNIQMGKVPSMRRQKTSDDLSNSNLQRAEKEYNDATSMVNENGFGDVQSEGPTSPTEIIGGNQVVFADDHTVEVTGKPSYKTTVASSTPHMIVVGNEDTSPGQYIERDLKKNSSSSMSTRPSKGKAIKAAEFSYTA